MKILAIDSSARVASAAIIEGSVLLSEVYSNIGLTHSETLLPMVQDALRHARLNIADIELFAVSNGPGSFTGIRIGIAAVKGMAMVRETPCAAVSTLEAMAYLLPPMDAIACCVMDARCQQVYTACFELAEQPLRLTEDEAISLSVLQQRLAAYKRPVMLVGDGAQLCYEAFAGMPDMRIAPLHLRYQRAAAVAYAAQTQQTVGAAELQPVYLRLPQAERELAQRKEKIQ